MAGDYGHFAIYLEPGAMAFFPSQQIAPGEHVLDVAYGAGQLALPAARSLPVFTRPMPSNHGVVTLSCGVPPVCRKAKRPPQRVA